MSGKPPASPKNPLTDGSKTCIPTLYTKSDTNEVTATHNTVEQKAALLLCTFFPPRPNHLPPYPGDSDPLPTPLPFSMPPLSALQRCIKQLRPHKAPGPDGIPNIVLKRASAILRRCFTHAYAPLCPFDTSLKRGELGLPWH